MSLGAITTRQAPHFMPRVSCSARSSVILASTSTLSASPWKHSLYHQTVPPTRPRLRWASFVPSTLAQLKSQLVQASTRVIGDGFSMLHRSISKAGAGTTVLASMGGLAHLLSAPQGIPAQNQRKRTQKSLPPRRLKCAPSGPVAGAKIVPHHVVF